MMMDREALERLIAFRRDLHRHPEAGWTEFRTTVKIIEALEGLGLVARFGAALHCGAKRRGVPGEAHMQACTERAIEETGRADLIDAMRGGYTGCVARIDGARPGPTVAIRVDIDCNELSESDSAAHRPVREGFRSVHPGLMHACGHDGHAAIGLGAAELLVKNREKIAGNVLLVFQPAEEGVRGAVSMVGAGLFETVDFLYGGHLGMKLPTGSIAAGTSGFMASSDHDIVFRGRSAHCAAAPEYGHNALAAAAGAVLNILAISRHSAGVTRVNVGKLEAGSGKNVVPDLARMAAQVRGGNNAIHDYMIERLDRICRAAAEMHECEYERAYVGGLQSAVCDRDFAAFVARVASGVDGVREVREDIDFGAGDDITFMMNAVQAHGGKATEMMLGADIAAPHHSELFDFDEAVIGLGARLFAAVALEIFKNGGRAEKIMAD